MKRQILITTALAGFVGLSGILPSAVLAHDALAEDALDKSELTNEQFFTGEVLRGTKNLKNWYEAAAIAPEIIREDGAKNRVADVYAHKGFAYLGTHVYSGSGNGGVRIFDLKDPANPVEVSHFAHDIPHTWQEKVIVKSVNTPHFKGDLAVVSVQQTSRNNSNRPDSRGGVLIYDVTNPYEPQQLGFWELDRRISGTHELYLTTQGNKALLLAANPYADFYTHGEQKDFQIVDVSDPVNPETIYQWNPRDLEEVADSFNGYHWSSPDGKTRPVFAHSAITDVTGRYAYVSMWDLGTVIFDLKNPSAPEVLGRTDFASHQQGSAHSANVAKGGTVLIETREISNPLRPGYEEGYGYTRIFDIKDKSNPIILSEFRTELTTQIPDDPALRNSFANTVHDPKVRGNTLYLSYNAGGIVSVDITNPSKPEEIARYTPEASNVWGVYVDRNYILASDKDSGLKVLLTNSGNNDNNGNTKK